MRRVRSLSIVVAITIALIATLASAVATPVRAQDPVKILIYGDSLAQGSSGDQTWRYFVDRSLRSSGVAFDFVGSTTAIHHESVVGIGVDTNAYADPEFDKDSSTHWGQALMLPEYNLTLPNDWPGESEVGTYLPDVVVTMIGFNDMAWLYNAPTEVAAELANHIARARAVKPEIDFVLVKYPNLDHSFVAPYNALLDQLSGALDSPTSRVVATDDYFFDLSTDTWDGLHPTGSGDAKIARRVASALESIGIGRANVPDRVAVGLPNVPTLSVAAGLSSAQLAWTPVAGAYNYFVEYRNLTRKAPWPAVGIEVPARITAIALEDLAAGDEYEVRVRTKKGRLFAEKSAAVVRIVALAPLTQVKVSAPAVSAVGRLKVAWTGDSAATAYRVELTRGNAVTTQLVRSGTSWERTGLRNGERLRIRVRSEVGAAVGAWSAPRTVTVPGLAAATKVRAVKGARKQRVKTTVPTIVGATRYRLDVASGKNCRKVPAQSKFKVKSLSTSRSVTVKTTAKFAWVQWRGERSGALGPLTRSAQACVKVG